MARGLLGGEPRGSEAAVLQRFGQVRALQRSGATIKVGDRACNPQDAVISARGQPQPLKRGFEPLPLGGPERAIALQFAGADLPVRPPGPHQGMGARPIL